MTISACDGAPSTDWSAAYRDWLASAARVDPWPHQSRRRTPPRQRAEVKPPLSGAEAQAAIRQRYQPPPTERAT